MSLYAKRALAALHVDVRVQAPVTECDADGVTIGAGHRVERLPAGTVIWAAGVAASPAGQWLGVETDVQGRVPVAANLTVPGMPNVFVIGDAAKIVNPDGVAAPGTAPAAKQQGRYIARVIAAKLKHEPGPKPFRYRNVGNLATIGRRSAVVEMGWLKLKGRLAWWLWGIAHVYFLIGLPSPLIVSIRWLWEYLTYGKGARLITGNRD
jgi:NADH dehydrogenase